MVSRARHSAELPKVPYQPPANYRFPVELLSFEELRSRASLEHLAAAKRIEFHLLIGIIRGDCVLTIDFMPYRCRRGSWLALRPGQVQRFDVRSSYDGWLVLFKPEFLLPRRPSRLLDELQLDTDFSRLATHQPLSQVEHRACVAAVAQMREDIHRIREDDASNVAALLRYQLYTLLLRLHVAQGRRATRAETSSISLERFERFRQAVERDYTRHHQLGHYARAQGCSEKTLTRAALDIAGVSAKAYLLQRIALEAKRQLAHTLMPASAIAAHLGFDEPTNFVKFFKRQSRMTPGQFRLAHNPPQLSR